MIQEFLDRVSLDADYVNTDNSGFELIAKNLFIIKSTNNL